MLGPTLARPIAGRRVWLAACGLACVVGIAVSFLQAAASHRLDPRVRAMRCIFDADGYSILGDTMPSIRAARILRDDPRAPIYDAAHIDASFLYSPLAALFYAPLVGEPSSQLREEVILASHLAWVAIGLLAIAIACGRDRTATMGEVIGIVAVLAVFYPLLRALELNQASLGVTLVLGLTWVLLQYEFEIAAGVVFMLAVAIKPHMALALPLLVRHAPRMVLTAIAAGLGLLGLSVLYAGWQNHVEYATHLLPALSRGYATATNQSYNGLFNRLLPGAPDIAAFTPAPARASVRILWALTATATYGLAVVAVRRLPRSKVGAPFVFGFAYLVATIVSPVAWEHHYASTLFVFAAAYRLYREDQDRTPPSRLLVPLTAAFIAICGYFEVRDLQGALPRLLASYVLFGALALAATYAAMLRALALGPPAPSTRTRT
jgi:hypothetical protein